MQVFGDTHGEAVHLFDRDCTAQRRHQKVIEEAPAVFVDPKTREEILNAAVKLCKESGYVGAGTVEFLLAPSGEFYFLEVNSRLQVEHPVTEETTGLDLVELQIRIAAGEKLSKILGSKNIKSTGHSIECRICAESPEQNFMTSTGQILEMNSAVLANIPGVRLDTGFGKGDVITHYYDSLIAKVIVKANSRSEAVQQTCQALRNFHICGIKTNIPYLLKILNSSEFSSPAFHINFAESLIPSEAEQHSTRALFGALSLITDRYRSNTEKPDSWNRNFAWRQSGSEVRTTLKVSDIETSFILQSLERDTYRVLNHDSSEVLHHLSKVSLASSGALSFLLEGRHHGCTLYKVEDRQFIATHLGLAEIEEFFPTLQSNKGAAHHSNEIRSPFPGKIVGVQVKKKDTVEAGTSLVILESMKMEHPLKAPLAATVDEINVKVGDIIEANKILVKLSFS